VSTITGLVPDRRGGRTRLEVDGEERASLPDSVVVARRLRKGQSVDANELAAILREAAFAAALEAALHSLSYRARSRVELVRHLRRKSHEAEAIAFAVTRCEKLGYLDDLSFARSFVRDRVRLKPRGRYGLRNELMAKGVSAEVADAAIEEVLREEGTSEPELLRRVAEGRVRALAPAGPDTARRRLTAWLLRRGFAREDVRKVVNDLLPGEDPDRPTGSIV
jgi:regulatory protein